jgi:hypothetical protein
MLQSNGRRHCAEEHDGPQCWLACMPAAQLRAGAAATTLASKQQRISPYFWSKKNYSMLNHSPCASLML